MSKKRRVSLDWYDSNDHSSNRKGLEDHPEFKARLSKTREKKPKDGRSGQEQIAELRKNYEQMVKNGRIERLPPDLERSLLRYQDDQHQVHQRSHKPSTWRLGKSPSDYG